MRQQKKSGGTGSFWLCKSKIRPSADFEGFLLASKSVFNNQGNSPDPHVSKYAHGSILTGYSVTIRKKKQ